MAPLKVGTSNQFVRVTQHSGRKKERMEEPDNFVEIEDVMASETESINPTMIEEEISTIEQVQVVQSMKNPNDGANPNPKTV
jgi:hypothetical protein